MTREVPTWTITAGTNGNEYDFTSECVSGNGNDIITTGVPSASFKFRNIFGNMNSQLTRGKNIVCSIEGRKLFKGRIEEVKASGDKKAGYILEVTARGVMAAFLNIKSSLHLSSMTPNAIIFRIIDEYNFLRKTEDPQITIASNMAPIDIAFPVRYQRMSIYEMLLDIANRLAAPARLGGNDTFYDFWVVPDQSSSTIEQFHFMPVASIGSTTLSQNDCVKATKKISNTNYANDVWVFGEKSSGRLPLRMQQDFVHNNTNPHDVWTEDITPAAGVLYKQSDDSNATISLVTSDAATTQTTILNLMDDTNWKDWSRNGGTSNYGRLLSNDSDSTYVYHRQPDGAVYKRDVYAVQDYTSSNIITNVKITCVARLTTPGDVQFSVGFYDTTKGYYGYVRTLTTSWNIFEINVPKFPWSGQNWTWSDINNIFLYIDAAIGSTTEVRVTHLRIDVTHTGTSTVFPAFRSKFLKFTAGGSLNKHYVYLRFPIPNHTLGQNPNGRLNTYNEAGPYLELISNGPSTWNNSSSMSEQMGEIIGVGFYLRSYSGSFKWFMEVVDGNSRTLRTNMEEFTVDSWWGFGIPQWKFYDNIPFGPSSSNWTVPPEANYTVEDFDWSYVYELRWWFREWSAPGLIAYIDGLRFYKQLVAHYPDKGLVGIVPPINEPYSTSSALTSYIYSDPKINSWNLGKYYAAHLWKRLRYPPEFYKIELIGNMSGSSINIGEWFYFEGQKLCLRERTWSYEKDPVGFKMVYKGYLPYDPATNKWNNDCEPSYNTLLKDTNLKIDRINTYSGAGAR